MRLASRTQIKTSTLVSGWNIHQIALEMKRKGDDVILLTVGDTDFDSPPAAVEAIKQSLDSGRTHYTQSSGTFELREAIARRHAILSQHAVTADQITVTIGAQNALLTTALCILDPGDEVIVPEPMYSTYPGTIATSGGTAIAVACAPGSSFHLSIEAIEQAITTRTRAIFLANPNNPTGAVYGIEELSALAKICQRHDLWLVSDEVYASITYDRPHVSVATLPGMQDRTIIISSLSKSHAMTGWRLGWMISPKPLAAAAMQLSGNSTYGIPTFIQDAAIVALDSEPYAREGLKEAYVRRRQLVCENLSNIAGISPQWPEGGMFVLLDVSQTGRATYDFAEQLLQEKKVALLPAEAFGPSTAAYLRINLGAPDADLQEATARIGDFVRSLMQQNAAE